ncbi:hypothetical protein MPH_04670 [Macrophomina phaseolina MS6]|uniref:Uncharacterized protein n=1 Tax=Macrophomina phaseolina (strain MS6) TaxID=1126212 RepID=K2RTP3_MACPH|nr:hypothetical protein MPH_04670 [Macrophomina phaseolina MS6]
MEGGFLVPSNLQRRLPASFNHPPPRNSEVDRREWKPGAARSNFSLPSALLPKGHQDQVRLAIRSATACSKETNRCHRALPHPREQARRPHYSLPGRLLRRLANEHHRHVLPIRNPLCPHRNPNRPHLYRQRRRLHDRHPHHRPHPRRRLPCRENRTRPIHSSSSSWLLPPIRP